MDGFMLVRWANVRWHFGVGFTNGQIYVALFYKDTFLLLYLNIFIPFT